MSSIALANPSGEGSNGGVAWPEQISLSVSSAVGTVNFSDVRFQDDDLALRMDGRQMSLSRVDLVGLEAKVGLSTEVLRVSLGFGYYVPRDASRTSLPEVGPNARVAQLHVSRWVVEVGIGRRFENISPFLLLSGSVVRGIVDVSRPSIAFSGIRLSLGPRMGFRAHLYKKLFLEASVYADMLSFPDHTLTFGLGVGDR